MSWEYVFELIKGILITQTGVPHLTMGMVVMLIVALIFLYLAVGKGFEPLLLLPSASASSW
jgi:oxaloacetate decarboxylase beta subunit